MNKTEYNATKKLINNLYAEIQKAERTEVGYTIREKARCEGHGIFVPTGEFHKVPVFGDKKRIAELTEQIATLETDEYLAFEKAEKNKAKERRYRKELEELNKRKAYLEKWLAENAN
jgi:hypothetical protein